MTLRDFLALELAHRTPDPRWGVQQGSTRHLAKEIGVAQGTALRLLTRVYTPDELTLSKIARRFRVPITEVRALAQRPAGEPDPFVWPARFNQLTEPQRDLLVKLGDALLDAAAHRPHPSAP
jgi:transcriptional regulator with XRE-family HTH domain